MLDLECEQFTQCWLHFKIGFLDSQSAWFPDFPSATFPSHLRRKLRPVFDASILLPNLSLLFYGFPTLANSLQETFAIFVHLQFCDTAFAGMNADRDTLTI